MIILCPNPACQQPFEIQPNRLKRTKKIYCSRACYWACYVPRSLEERFWSKVDTTSTPDGCWLWKGSHNKKLGYGILSLPCGEKGLQRQFLAHRIGFILQYGPIPPGLWVLHKPPCVNRLCVRHIYLGTPEDNTYDMVSLGRATMGAQNAKAKLTDQDAAAIRAVYTGARGEQAALARQYHVSPSRISDILRNRTYCPWRP